MGDAVEDLGLSNFPHALDDLVLIARDMYGATVYPETEMRNGSGYVDIEFKDMHTAASFVMGLHWPERAKISRPAEDFHSPVIITVQFTDRHAR